MSHTERRNQQLEWFACLARVALEGHEAAAMLGRKWQLYEENALVAMAVAALAKCFDDSQTMLRSVLKEYGDLMHHFAVSEHELAEARSRIDVMHDQIMKLRAQKGGN